ncbi:hypothetical protein [Dyadobacter sp. CY343]|uniref:hypothetical protein n=1 Tax=Dyadobacter sp. CY343 TaxID=2907299 RepID=UPI001F1C69A6|nr:hypothetical protein [Dyadobacter sp. CY343]MCE7061649.1 hypothetical protein [Dyadobacter sp. CY343]
MKPFEEIQEEIQLTLEKIARTNAAIARHESQEGVDNLAIQQYRDFKKQLTEQLLELLEQMDIRFDVAA